MNLRTFGPVALAGLLPACAAPRARDHAAPSDLDRLASYMTGSFSSAAQAAADPEHFREVSLHMTPIWTTRPDGPWLYVEQAMATTLDKPYRQRVYRLSAGAEPGTLVSAVFELPGDPLAFAGAWREPARLDGLAPDNLIPREGCSIILRARGDTFVGSTQGHACASTLRGAAYATSEVTITSTMLRSWDRGFDASGTQVWGAEAGGYEFVKQQ
jgi:hypothetical protein